MGRSSRIPVFSVILITGLFCVSPASHALLVTGEFLVDNEVAFVDFELIEASNVTFVTSSWIAGDNGLGFDPVLSLWAVDDSLIALQDDGGSSGSFLSGSTYNYGEWDVNLDISLGSGTYTAAITQYDNFPYHKEYCFSLL